MAVGDYLCELKHLCEVDISFAENAGQRLDIVKFPRIIGDCWRERDVKSERERESGREGKKREWSSGHPWDSPNLELRALLGGLMSPFFPHVTKQPRAHICKRQRCLD